MELRYQLQSLLPVRRHEMYGRLGVPYPLDKSPYALHDYRLARELLRRPAILGWTRRPPRGRGPTAPAAGTTLPSSKAAYGSTLAYRRCSLAGRSTATGTTPSCRAFSPTVSGRRAPAAYAGTGDPATSRAALCSFSTTGDRAPCRTLKGAAAVSRRPPCTDVAASTTASGTRARRSTGSRSTGGGCRRSRRPIYRPTH